MIRIFFKKEWKKLSWMEWTTIRLWSRKHNDQTLYAGRLVANWLGSWRKPIRFLKVGEIVSCERFFLYQITNDLAQRDAEMSKEGLQDWLIQTYHLPPRRDKNPDAQAHVCLALITQKEVAQDVPL